MFHTKPFRFPRFPSKPHRSGQARIRIKNRDYYLGKFGSQEARVEYARLAAVFAADPGAAPAKEGPLGVITIGILIAQWYEEASRLAPRSKEVRETLRAITIVDRKFGSTPAADFDVNSLEIVREHMITGSWMTPAEKDVRIKKGLPVDWCRNHVNHMINRVRKVFRWAERRKLVPGGTWDHLRSLETLKKGSGARRTKKRQPVADTIVEATLPHLHPMVAAMVTLQLRCGLRPTELVEMQAKDIRRDGPEGSWLYKIDESKTMESRADDEEEFAVIGPEGQKALAPWLDAADRLGPQTFIWRPNAAKPNNLSANGYYQAVRDACARAKVPRWTPYQLRHSAKRRVERIAGEQGARAFLRQKSVESTRHYASEQDLETAAKIASKIG